MINECQVENFPQTPTVYYVIRTSNERFLLSGNVGSLPSHHYLFFFMSRKRLLPRNENRCRRLRWNKVRKTFMHKKIIFQDKVNIYKNILVNQPILIFNPICAFSTLDQKMNNPSQHYHVETFNFYRKKRNMSLLCTWIQKFL